MDIDGKRMVEIFRRNVDLSKYVDSVEVDVENFEDYHELRRELRKAGKRGLCKHALQ